MAAAPDEALGVAPGEAKETTCAKEIGEERMKERLRQMEELLRLRMAVIEHCNALRETIDLLARKKYAAAAARLDGAVIELMIRSDVDAAGMGLRRRVKEVKEYEWGKFTLLVTPDDELEAIENGKYKFVVARGDRRHQMYARLDFIVRIPLEDLKPVPLDHAEDDSDEQQDAEDLG